MFNSDTKIGIELEIGPSRANISALNNIFSPFTFQIHDDGSCRDRTYRIDSSEGKSPPASLGIVPPLDNNGDYAVPMFMRSITASGLEVVFNPVSYKEAKSLVNIIKETFSHIHPSNHTGIHIHVDVRGKPFWFIKNVIMLFYYHEALLYRISAGGVIHRGESFTKRGYRDYSGNINHRFARPLSNSIGVEYLEGGWSNLIDTDELTHAKSFSQLLKAWGRLDALGWPNMTHYAPHRLHGINIQSIAEHGTVELRIFNSVFRHMPLFLEVTASLFRKAWELGKRDVGLFYEPMILGRENVDFDGDIKLKEVEELLGLDIDPSAWGCKWVSAPGELVRHHYSMERFRLDKQADLVRVPSTSGTMMDDFSSEFIPRDDLSNV